MGHKTTEQPKWPPLKPKRITFYRNDAQIKYHGRIGGGGGGGARGDVTELSRKSLRRLAFVAANTAVEFVSMITLTYPRAWVNDGKQVKNDLAAFLAWARRRWSGLSYLWFLEFQRRGAPHFHILFNHPYNSDDNKPISKAWYKIVDSGDRRHLQAGTRNEGVRNRDGLRRYVVKYAMKPDQKIVPPDYSNVGRYWGHSRDVKPKPLHERELIGGRSELDAIANALGVQSLPDGVNWGVMFNWGRDV